MSVLYDWDALAPYWHVFERRGSDEAVVAAALMDGSQAPLLFVGSGLGTYAAMVAARLGVVVAVDRSAEMSRRAKAMHPELTTIVADLAALPFANATFRGVVCATGVIELLGEGLPAAYRELARVVRGAPIHVSAFVRNAHPFDVHAAAEAWLAEVAPDEQLDRLAVELGDRASAARLVQRAMPRYAVGVAEADVIGAASAARLSTQRLLHDELRGMMLWCHR